MAVSRTRRARAARKRQRRMARVEHDLTDAQWTDLQAAWGGCAYCGAAGPALQRDCVLAISRGGRYTLDNVVPACRSCNASKCNDEVTGWMRRKRLDERTFLLRHLEIRTLLLLPDDTDDTHDTDNAADAAGDDR
ncbi:MAG: HNH endonuclease [Microthrixaceae bacterium]